MVGEANAVENVAADTNRNNRADDKSCKYAVR